MQKRSAKNSEKDKPSWDWMQVECNLKINESNKKSVIWSLTPTIILTNPTSQYSDPNVRLYIDTQKSLQYSSELGWNWHKSWNLPNISLRLEIKDENSGQQLLAPKNLYAQMLAVKKNSQSQRHQHMSLIDVGIRGDGKMEMIDGQVYFSAMKFSSTTYNNEGCNFNLLIVLYINQDGVDKPKILTAVISPGIFVDSRRSARDYQQKKFNSFIEPFLYQNLEKEYIKRQNKSKTQSQVVIKNDPQGFYNYLTAPNIRHKVKHPIFLAIKFSNCVQILYNTQLLQNMTPKISIQNLQRKLLKENKSKAKPENGFAGNPNEKTFIFLVQNINDSLKKKKIMQSIETMENTAIGIVYDRKQFGPNFQSIGDSEQLIKAYRQSYENLVQQCKKYQSSDSEDNSQSEEDQLPSERSVKKIKLDEYPKISTRNSNFVKRPTVPSENFYLKKQQEDLPLQQPKFFPPTLNDFGSKKGSAFNRAVGFKSIIPEIEGQQRNHELNHYSISKAQQPQIRLNHQVPTQPIQQQGKNLQNLICNNLMLSNWLSSVKNNNVSLYDTMIGNNGQEISTQSMDRFNNRQVPRQHENVYQVNQQLQCLMQQVNLYRELLAQVTYQNTLLGGRSFAQNGTSQASQPQGMNYPPQMLHNMISLMGGLGGLGPINPTHGLSNLGMGLGNLGNGSGLNPTMSSQGMGVQGYQGQVGMGMAPNLPSLQTFQMLQSLGMLGQGSMGQGGMSQLHGNQQSSPSVGIQQLLRSQLESQNRLSDQQKRNREDSK